MEAIVVELVRDLALSDYKTRKTVLLTAGGVCALRRTPNPFSHEDDWLVVEGTTVGGSCTYWYMNARLNKPNCIFHQGQFFLKEIEELLEKRKGQMLLSHPKRRKKRDVFSKSPKGYAASG